MKVWHANAILQLVGPAYAAAQEHVKTRIWNFRFLRQVATRGNVGRCGQRGSQSEAWFQVYTSIVYAPARIYIQAVTKDSWQSLATPQISGRPHRTRSLRAEGIEANPLV